VEDNQASISARNLRTKGGNPIVSIYSTCHIDWLLDSLALRPKGRSEDSDGLVGEAQKAELLTAKLTNMILLDVLDKIDQGTELQAAFVELTNI
jgi:hypothetical protein